MQIETPLRWLLKRGYPLLFFSLVLITQCSKEGEWSEPEKTIIEYLQARKEQDYQKAYSFLTERSRRGEPFPEFEKYCSNRENNFSKIETELLMSSDSLARVRTSFTVNRKTTEYDVWLANTSKRKAGGEGWRILHNDVLINQVYLLFNEGRFLDASEFCLRALSLNPHDANGYNILGNCYLKDYQMTRDEESFEKGVRAFVIALSLEPRSTHNRANLSSLYFSRMDFKRAKALLLEALEIEPQNKGIQEMLKEIPNCNGICGILEKALWNESVQLPPQAREFIEENPLLFPSLVRIEPQVKEVRHGELLGCREEFWKTLVSVEGRILRIENGVDLPISRVELISSDGGEFWILYPGVLYEKERGDKVEVVGLPLTDLLQIDGEGDPRLIILLLGSEIRNAE